MDARWFLAEVVDPTILDFRNNHLSWRHALAAVAVVDMLMAHVFEYIGGSGSNELNAKDDSDFRNILAKENLSVELLRDVAKAQKHVTLTRHQPKVSSFSDTSLVAKTYGSGAYGVGPYGGGFMVKISDGKNVSLLSLISEALDFLCVRFDLR